MFCILDTNHYTSLASGGAMATRLRNLAAERKAETFITVITAQEITQGWLAAINREKAGPDQVYGYGRFLHSIQGFTRLTILPFDGDAAQRLLELQGRRLRVGTMDLKIAAICLAHDALLLSRNLVDFQKIPGLRVENWLD